MQVLLGLRWDSAAVSPAVYSERFPGIPDLPYVWPVQAEASEPASST
jgi:hypothetical protein